MDNDIFEEEEAVEEQDVCPSCGRFCICDEIAIQYEPMQTDDAAVDHTVWTLAGRVLA